MDTLLFRSYKEQDYNDLVPMIMELYESTPGWMTPEKIDKTLSRLALHQETGKMLIFEQDHQVVGYALLASYWSNEFGGMVLIIDELVVKAAYRNLRISTRFFTFLFERKLYNETAYMLEVALTNHKAAAFYKRMGFLNFKTKHQLRMAR